MEGWEVWRGGGEGGRGARGGGVPRLGGVRSSVGVGMRSSEVDTEGGRGKGRRLARRVVREVEAGWG